VVLRIIAQAQGKDLSYILLQPANRLNTFAQTVKDNHMAAFALIKRAEALRTELHYRLGTIDKQDLITQINRAKASYTEALEKGSSNPSLMATAKLGLGLCEEELGNFEKARQIYLRPAPKPKPPAAEKLPIEIKPSEANLPADTNLPIDINLIPQAPNIAPVVPDINLESQTPNNVSATTEVNLPGK